MSEQFSPQFSEYLQDYYPKLWQGWLDKTLAINEIWLIKIAEVAFEAGRRCET